MVVLSSTSVNAMEISLSRVAASSDQEELKEPYVEYGKLVNHLTYFEQNSEYTLSATISDSGITRLLQFVYAKKPKVVETMGFIVFKQTRILLC